MVACTSVILAAAVAGESLAQNVPSRSFKAPLRRREPKEADLDRRATGEEELSSAFYGLNWDIDVTIGGQKFTFGVDTGSSPLWVLSTRLSLAQQRAFSSHEFFDPSQSPTFQNTSGHFNVAYDKGENYLSGDVGTDNVSMAGLSVNMPIGVATNVSQNVIGDDTDGIFGMAFGTSNQLGRGAPTFMEAVMSQLDEPVFTFNLPVGSGAQSIEFGKVDKNLYTGDLQAVAIQNGTSTSGHGWHAYVSYMIGDKNVSSELQSTLFDTGGITALANEDVVRNYWAQVAGAQDKSTQQDATQWSFPCNSALPDLTYNLLGLDGSFVNATVPGRFFNYTALYRKSPSSSNVCTGALNSNGRGSGTMGYAFWHAFFTVFDQSVPSVSFASYPQKELNAVPQVTGTLASGTPTGIPSAVPSSTAVNSAVSYKNPDAVGVMPTATEASRSTAGAVAVRSGQAAGLTGLVTSLLMLIGV